MCNKDTMHDAETIWRIIRSLHRAARLQQQAAAGTELGHNALGVLNLAAVSPTTPSRISRELGLPPQTVSRAITDLEAAKLIARQGDPGDGRSYAVGLTAEGRRTVTTFRQNLSEEFAAHLTDWEPHEVTEFASHLEALITALVDNAPARPARARGRNSWRSTSR